MGLTIGLSKVFLQSRIVNPVKFLLYEVVPSALSFRTVNRVMGKKQLAELIDDCYRICGEKETVLLADKLRTLGYTNATKAGISICIDDMRIPERKAELLGSASDDVREIEDQYTEGLITDGERYNKVVDIWAQVAEQVANEMMQGIGSEDVTDEDSGQAKSMPSFNPIYIMADSGARGSAQQIRQLAGMRGLMAKPSGEIIATPITEKLVITPINIAIPIAPWLLNPKATATPKVVSTSRIAMSTSQMVMPPRSSKALTRVI